MPLGYLPGGVEFQQLFGQLPSSAFDPFLYPSPIGCAETGQRGWAVQCANVGSDPVQLVGGHVELVLLGVLQDQVLLVLLGFANLGGPSKAGYAVVNVDHVAARDQVG